MSEWIPTTESKVAKLSKAWVLVMDEEGAYTKYRWDPELAHETREKIGKYLDARALFSSVDSTGNRILRNETKKEAIAAMRLFANSSVRYNRHMDEAAKQAMGICPPDKTQTPQRRPTLRPNMAVERTPSLYQHRLKALNPENSKNAKPDGVHGVRFAWQVGGERPISGQIIINGQFSRKPILMRTYSEMEKNQVVWYACCYENTRGEAGPWSPVAEAYIT